MLRRSMGNLERLKAVTRKQLDYVYMGLNRRIDPVRMAMSVGIYRR